MQLQPMSRISPLVASATSICSSATSGADVAPSCIFPQHWLLIRRLGPNDRAALAAHLLALPPKDRRTRFGANSGDAAIRRHCEALDLEETVCFAALDGAGAVAGAAFGFLYDGGAGQRCLAEIAVSVAPDYRRRGLGATLVSRVCDAVTVCGAEAAIFEFDPSNLAIRSLVRHLGGLVAPFAESCAIPLSALH